MKKQHKMNIPVKYLISNYSMVSEKKKKVQKSFMDSKDTDDDGCKVMTIPHMAHVAK
jgi:hypothetical protein